MLCWGYLSMHAILKFLLFFHCPFSSMLICLQLLCIFLDILTCFFPVSEKMHGMMLDILKVPEACLLICNMINPGESFMIWWNQMCTICIFRVKGSVGTNYVHLFYWSGWALVFPCWVFVLLMCPLRWVGCKVPSLLYHWSLFLLFNPLIFVSHS